MGRLIKADLRRNLRKKSYYTSLLFLVVIQFFNTIADSEKVAEQFLSAARSHLTGLTMLVITIVIFLGVFADDQQSRSMVTLVGRGMRRGQIFTAKLFDCMILSTLLFTIIVGMTILFINLFSIPITGRQQAMLWFYIIFLVLRSAGFLAMSMLVLYLTDSTALGIITDVFVSAILGYLFLFARAFDIFNAVNYWFSGLLDEAYSYILIGRFPWQLIPAVFFYIAIPICIAAVVNQGKEMEL